MFSYFQGKRWCSSVALLKVSGIAFVVVVISLLISFISTGQVVADSVQIVAIVEPVTDVVVNSSSNTITAIYSNNLMTAQPTIYQNSLTGEEIAYSPKIRQQYIYDKDNYLPLNKYGLIYRAGVSKYKLSPTLNYKPRAIKLAEYVSLLFSNKY